MPKIIAKILALINNNDDLVTSNKGKMAMPGAIKKRQTYRLTNCPKVNSKIVR